MNHLSSEQLAELALPSTPGSRVEPDPAGSSHLLDCTECRAQVEALRATVAQVRGSGLPHTLVTPPTSTWTAIRQQISDVPEPVRTPSGSTIAPSNVAEAARPRRPARTPERSRWRIGLAAAVGIAVGVAGALGATAAGLPPWLHPLGPVTPTRPPTATVLARAELSPLNGTSGGGTATVVRTPAGTRLDLDVRLRPTPGHYYELWLANADLSRMYALGMVNTAGASQYALPAAPTDLTGFATLDISLQQYNGNPAHSHRSLARGVLR